MPADTATYPGAQPLRIPVESRRRAAGRTGVMRLVSGTLLCAVVLLILVAIGGMALGLWRFSVIDTGSMRPTLAPGDVAVLTSEPRSAIARGQIVAFHPPGRPGLTVVHRVFAVRRTGDGVVIRTKGDANNAPDEWRARLAGDTVWRESAKVPLLGYLSVFSAQRPVRFGLMITIVMLLVTALLGAIWRSSPR
jgi:signal peptidase I